MLLGFAVPASLILLPPALRAGDLGRLPLSFEQNEGQTAGEVKFLARTAGYTVFLTDGEAVLSERSGTLRMKLLGANPAPKIRGVDAVTNKGPVTVTVSKVSIAGADPGDFSQTNTCATLASGASCFVTVTFTPTATGQRSAGILIFDNGGGSPQSALLTGAGT